jgi:hypothetical protein
MRGADRERMFARRIASSLRVRAWSLVAGDRENRPAMSDVPSPDVPIERVPGSGNAAPCLVENVK